MNCENCNAKCKIFPCQEARKTSKKNNDSIVKCKKCSILFFKSMAYKRYDSELGINSLYCPDCKNWAEKMKEKYGY